MKTLLLLGWVAFLVSLSICNSAKSSVVHSYNSEVMRLAKAAQIKAYMNEDRPPCENFYKFACGNWHRLHPASQHGAKTSYLGQLQELYVRKSAEMLKTVNKYDTSADTILKNLYSSCRSQPENVKTEWEAIIKLVDFNGGWPEIKLPSWYENEYDWLKVVADLRRLLGVDILIGLDITPDFVDRNVNRIKVGAPQLQLGSRNTYAELDYFEKCEQYKYRIARKLLNFFPHMGTVWADEVSVQVLGMEELLAKGLPYNTTLTIEQSTRKRTAADIKSAYGHYVDISRYLNIIFNETIYLQVYETPEDYLSNLVDVIRQTPKLVIANYTMWRTLEVFDAFRPPQHEQKDVWCVHQVNKYFSNQLQSLFNRNYNSMKMINEVQSTWADIRKVFREALQASELLHWMKLETRQKAILKLDALELQFRSQDEASLIMQMHGLTLCPENYNQNMIKVLQWKAKQNLEKLFQIPKIRNTEILLPKYDLSSNKIHVPIAFLQARFFWDQIYPEAIKYGTLGFILAQEMLHGFNMVGRLYDKYGYRNNWWDRFSEAAFNERAQCFENLTAVFRYKDQIIEDPDMTSKCIVDIGALRIANRAYLKWLRNAADNETTSKETMPLLYYTQYQLYFIVFAQNGCTDFPDSQLIFTEYPEMLRVNAALSNFEEFSLEFKCEVESKMNPRNKCTSLY